MVMNGSIAIEVTEGIARSTAYRITKAQPGFRSWMAVDICFASLKRGARPHLIRKRLAWIFLKIQGNFGQE